MHDAFRPPPLPCRWAVAVTAIVVTGAPAVGCSSGSNTVHGPVTAAPPPRDDGKPAQGGAGGGEHSAALEELRVAPIDARADKQISVRVPLPDAQNWTRVKFWGVPSLVGFRYGKDHHAIVAAFVTHVADETEVGACAKSFEQWAMPFVDTFDVELVHDSPRAIVWNGAIADIDALFAKTATLAARDAYAAAYAAYPAWKGACLVVGIAVPARDDEARARAVRDRYVQEALPKVQILSSEEPKERY